MKLQGVISKKRLSKSSLKCIATDFDASLRELEYNINQLKKLQGVKLKAYIMYTSINWN